MDANKPDWIKLTSFADSIQADIVISILEGSGVPVFVKSDDAGGLYQPLTVASGVELFVPAEKIEYARELLSDISTT